MNPELDLVIERVIRAPRRTIWRAWTTPELFAEWWIPEPYACRIESFDPTAGGGFVTSMSEDGVSFVPHMDAAFLVVDEAVRLVFTNAVDSTLRPASPQPVAVTGEVTLVDHADGTLYRILARHADPEARARHEELGLVEGWSAVTGQLAALIEA
ncbi:activator of HSP90 ATPase [Pseudoclavibacter endophyticus]|uniref:Polyketide cyclase n=1 Tax=Pseudoclavibacter endophyticus TaxID=1778590 RepID=A0A6H9WPQ0_9MICO|nr:SRPBCC domain-containing protein [Pseudoclavibacter endophyticus]KAB1649731.1 polyketide cyclase [Pseudoclavibacter endophyticus]GGA60198.1 activator of HSP90 ATPase [Pseudoclavibacter endophyticus]